MKGQRSLAEFGRKPSKPLKEGGYTSVVDKKLGTRPFPSFPIRMGLVIDQFLVWLPRVEGKSHHLEEAKQFATDVSKALR